MDKVVVVVWMCLWWVGQNLCHQPVNRSSAYSPWKPVLQSASGQRIPSLNKTPVRTTTRNLPQPVPGISEDASFKRENASMIVPVTQTHKENTSHSVPSITQSDKVLYETSKNNSRDNVVSLAVPAANTDNEDNEHHPATGSSAAMGSTFNTSGQEHHLRYPHSRNESHGPARDNRPMNMPGDPSVPKNTTTGRRHEGHGRVIVGPRELCSFCLCDVTKENVICKHDHVEHNQIHELILNHQVIPPSAKTLHVIGFERVAVERNTFSQANLTLRNIHFEDIARMELPSESLHFSSKAVENMEVAIIFTNCYIPEMPQETLTQMTRSEDPKLDITLQKTRFLSLRIYGCNITVMHSYALHNARLLFFHMTKTKVEDMEENSVHLDSFEEWNIDNSQLPNLMHKSICLRAQGIVIFSHNTFLGLGNRSLDIVSSNQVLFEFNFVSHLRSEALLGIQPQKDARGASIVFLNNTIDKADKHSLLASKHYPLHERKIIGNRFNIPCECNIKTTFENLLGITNKSDYNDLRTFNAVTQKSFCQVYAKMKYYATVKMYVSQYCTPPVLAIAAGSTVALVVLILVVVCIVCNRRVQKAREEANYLGECCISQSFSTLNSNPQLPMSQVPGPQSQFWDPASPPQPWVVAVPEVKTYKEMELNVAYEHTEPMNVSMRDSFPLEPGPILDLQRRMQMRSSCPFN